MKYCSHCGKEITDNGITCPHCARSFAAPVISGEDAPSLGLAVFAFFFQLIGFIMYVAYKGSSPQKAMSALKGSIIGSVFSFVLWFILEALGINLLEYFM